MLYFSIIIGVSFFSIARRHNVLHLRDFIEAKFGHSYSRDFQEISQLLSKTDVNLDGVTHFEKMYIRPPMNEYTSCHESLFMMFVDADEKGNVIRVREKPDPFYISDERYQEAIPDPCHEMDYILGDTYLTHLLNLVEAGHHVPSEAFVLICS